MAGTLLLDVKNRKWSKEISEKFNVPIKLLTPILESTDKVSVLKKELIDKYGFKHNVDIFAGEADNACGAVVAGIMNQDKSMVSIGTFGVFFIIS